MIHMPAGYASGEERYAALYLLDGGAHFHHTTGTTSFLADNGRMPEMIVVGVRNTQRLRDLTPTASDDEDARERGAELREGLLKIQKKHPKIVGDVRGMGLMQAVELVVDETAGDRTPNAAAVKRLFEETKKRKLLIGKGGLHGNIIRITPMLNVTKDEIAEAVKILDESFDAMVQG